MKAAFTFLFIFFLLTGSSQEKYKKVITGKLSLKIFSKDAELKRWFTKEYENYHPDEAVRKNLKEHLAGKKIIVVLGTWCSDTQREFPRLLKVLDAVQFPSASLIIYGVNRKISLPPKIVAKYKITHVPTIIILNEDGTEKGRIVETVKQSMERDLESILK